MSRDRAFRRDREEVQKTKSRKLLRRWWKHGTKIEEPSDRAVGHMASTHRVPCSCEMCCNIRRSSYAKGDQRLTIQERRDLHEVQDQKSEVA